VGGRRLKNECCGAKETYGAEMESIFLLRIGSDILADRGSRYSSGSLLKGVGVVRERSCKMFGELSESLLVAPLCN
jgi:hypothetical protein